jgi:hypothetical protein
MKRAYVLLLLGLWACGADVDDTTDAEDGGGGAAAAVTSAGAGGADGQGGAVACGADAPTTAGVACDYAYDAFNASPSVNAESTVAWSCDASSRSMTSDGIPDHETGAFPNANCPNTMSAYSAAATVTLTPVDTGVATKIGVVGYALNGVKFDPSTAGTCTVDGQETSCSLIGDSGTWNIEALGQTSFDFGVDDQNAHVQPTGEYHYHGMPEAVLAARSGGAAVPTLVGFALDGFPVYARYGYSSAMDATSAVVAMTGSYRLKSTPDSGRPSTDTYPMGAFTQDYEYAAGAGDLDECNGRFDVTPEFPCGIYHYYITDSYPFISRCERGTPSQPSEGSGGMMGGGMGGMGGMGGPPTCAPGQSSMCCGDGMCDGPETHANCPADCP